VPLYGVHMPNGSGNCRMLGSVPNQGQGLSLVRSTWSSRAILALRAVARRRHRGSPPARWTVGEVLVSC
jgi:hypothetical protein